MTTHVWRSLLFVPAINEKHLAKAHARGADAIILDLEDSVAPEQKGQARDVLSENANALAEHGCDVLVRVNAEFLEADIATSCLESVCALVIPKVSAASTVLESASLLELHEAERGLEVGRIRLIAQIEDVHALTELDTIASSSPRLLGMSLGSEDFSASVGMRPLNETLYGPNQQIVFACRRAGILPFGFPASITLINDADALAAAVKQAADMGMEGAFCIHPRQIAVLNNAMTPSHAAVEDAQALLRGFDEAQADGKAVFSHNGKMVDLPVVLRARSLVERAKTIENKAH